MKRVPSRALLRSEWTKLRSLRAVWLAVVVYVALVAAGAMASLGGTTAEGVPVASALVGFGPAQFALFLVGALAVTSEYRTGTILVSLTAVPRRTRWLIAKTLVVVVWVAILTGLLAVGCLAAVVALTVGVDGLSTVDPMVLQPVGLQMAAAVLVAVLGVGLGALFRRTVPAVALGSALVAVLPVATALAGRAWVVGTSWLWPTLRVGEDDILTVAARGGFGFRSGGTALLAGATSWPTGLMVVGAWALVVWALGAVVIERRDV